MVSDRLKQLLPLLAVMVAAAASCVQLFSIHREHYRDQWVGASHDRNAHYRYGLMIAADLKNGDVARFFKDFDAGSWVWPPLNGITLCAVTLATGPSPVFAAVPALAGWFITAVFAYLLAVRVSGRFGVLAGLLASACVIVSPAHRYFSTDVMLESMGAGLTLVSLHAFVIWSQTRSVSAARWLGVVLTLLFLQKYNYWVLVMVALLPVHTLEHRGEYLQFMERLGYEVPWRNWLLAQLRRPLNYVIAILLGLIAAIHITGGFTLNIGSKPVEVRNDQTLVTLAYALALLRISFWWWTGGRQAARTWLLPYVFPLLDWHIFPSLAWLAIPHRFGKFLWYVASPTNNNGDFRPSFLEGVQFYWNVAVDEYAPVPGVMIALAVGLGIAAVLMFVPRVYRTGGIVVPFFAIVAMLLTFKHPNHQERFLHTGIVGVYVAAAVGYAGLLGLIARMNKFANVAGIVVLSLALAGLLYLAGPDLGGRGHASGPGLRDHAKSVRGVTDIVAPLVNEGEPTAIFSNIPSKFWAAWLYLERFPQHTLLQTTCREVGVLSSPTAEQFDVWCKETKTQQIIFVNIAKDSSMYEEASLDETSATIIDLLPHSPFKLVQTRQVEGYGTITVWRRP